MATANHHEHAAIARAILGLLSAHTGIEFETKVDVCGGNMWVWNRKMHPTDGLTILKSADCKLAEVPMNWRDHLNVIKGTRKRTAPDFASDDIDVFEELSGKNNHVKLEAEHQRLIEYLGEASGAWWWDSDHHMLVTHTADLKSAHIDLGLRGIYDTISSGSERGIDHNCFAYPLPKGAWVVRRYTVGTAEHPTWEQDANGWTMCYFNREPTLKTASRTCGAVEDTDGSFVFREAETAASAASQLGVQIELPAFMGARETRFKEDKHGRLIVEIAKEANDPPEKMNGWLQKKNKTWQRIYDARLHVNSSEDDTTNYDDIVRHMVSTADEDMGWVMRTNDYWIGEPLNHVRTYLQSTGLKTTEVTGVVGNCIAKPWKIINKPFDDEYPGNRQWNRNSAKFNFSKLSEAQPYPTWESILQHCGESLDYSLSQDPWAQENSITSGADYLKCWIASLFQEPEEPLPYLFLYGPQNSGKSMFHESIELLVTNGVVRADASLINQSAFNAEIAHAILCVTEEINLNTNNQAYHRIKDWVTSRKINIHEKGKTPYSIVNTTHWVQCANEIDAVPLFPGDSRITVLFVDKLAKLVPKKEMIPQLVKEAPAFLTSVLSLELPRVYDRLNVPVIETEHKKQAQKANRTPLQGFIDEKCYHVDGEWILFSEFYDFFKNYVEPEVISLYSKIKVGRELQTLGIVKGRNNKDNQVYVGNLSFKPLEPRRKRYTLQGEHLV